MGFVRFVLSTTTVPSGSVPPMKIKEIMEVSGGTTEIQKRDTVKLFPRDRQKSKGDAPAKYSFLNAEIIPENLGHCCQT